MKRACLFILGCLFGFILSSPLITAGQTVPATAAALVDLKMPETDLRENGAFGFSQKEATVLCDNADLRLSVWNNLVYLYVQAVLWKDNDPALGKTDDGRTIGDWSELLLRVNPSSELSANVDRDYLLNPWPGMSGLYYQICLGKGSTTGIRSDTSGCGAIRYVQTPEGRKIRVDVFLIPLAEISKHVGDTIRLCYYGDSPVPALTVNSCGYDRGGQRYYGNHIPNTNYNSYVFTAGKELVLDNVPDGRHDPSLAAPRHRQPAPPVGTTAPEIAAKDWLNAGSSPTLAALHGKAVLLEFWATWCGPCVESIPHLNQWQAKYADKGFVILSFTEQDRQGIERFLKRTPMVYAIGTESDTTFDLYGVTGIPQAFLLDESGKIVWEGNSGDQSLEGAIRKALKIN